MQISVLPSPEYLAGLFDGEGCIDVQRMYPKDGKGRLYVRPRVRICMSSSASSLLQKLHARFRGHLAKRPAGGPNQQSSLSLEWLSESDIRSILTLILPLLELKAEQARLALWWLENAKGRQTTASYPGMEKARATFAEELAAMKRDPYRSSEQAIERIAAFMQCKSGRSDVHATLVTKVCKKTGYAYPSLRVLAAPSYLSILQKSFGGQLQHMDSNPLWSVSLSHPRKIEQVLEHCAPHLKSRRGAAAFLLKCAKAGNLRDGKMIHEAIGALNAQSYDPKQSDADVQQWLARVCFDLPKRPRGRPTGILEMKPRRRPEPTGLIETNASDPGTILATVPNTSTSNYDQVTHALASPNVKTCGPD
jgi:hypothetical protein